MYLQIPGFRAGIFLLCFTFTLVATLAAIPAARGDIPVNVELVLAVDSSASVDRAEFAQQLHGLSRAFSDPEIHAAITGGAFRAIAVTLIEWSGADRQAVNIPWRLLDSAESAEAFAAEITASPRLVETGATSISAAISFAVPLFAANAYDGQRQVIDISGDGPNNSGRTMHDGRRIADAAGVTVNGLAIRNQVPDLGHYFEDHVITGPGSFTIIAEDYEDYMQAIHRKLLREIRAIPVS